MEKIDDLPTITAIKELIIHAMEECTDADLLDLIYKLLCEAGAVFTPSHVCSEGSQV